MLAVYLSLDIVTYLSSFDHFWSSAPFPASIPISTPLPFPFLNSLPQFLSGLFKSEVLAKLVRTYVMAYQLYISMMLEFWVGIMPFLLFGHLGVIGDEWGSPNSWPPFFGDLGVISDRGIRGFWGETWHQSMRFVSS